MSIEALKTPEIMLGDFLLPWGMVISALGFLAAWVLVMFAERMAWTRHVWNLPLFFVSLAVLLGCAIGIYLAP